MKLLWLKWKRKREQKKLIDAIAVCDARGFSVVEIKTIGGTDYIRYRDGSLRKLGKVAK